MVLIDITPEGAKTPEGRARIAAAISQLDHTNAECANALENVLHLLKPSEARAEALAKVQLRNTAQNEFFAALRGGEV